MHIANLHARTHPALALSTTPTAKTTASTTSAQSLESEIEQAFSNVLKQFGVDPNSIKLTFQSNPGQQSGTGQNSATNSSSTGTNAATTATTATTSASGTSGGGKAGASSATDSTPVTSGLAELFSTATFPTSSPVVQSQPAQVQHWYASTPADDAYWSKQPPAVQQLREIQDEPTRDALAHQLAGQGYTIDVPIMVWGWDAAQTMAFRQSAGYTWVPSALQANVTAAPGVSGGGVTPYNPNTPPPGSIMVG